MTTSTADDDPPRCHHNKICTATPSKPIQELIAAKDGTRGIDSTKYPNPTFLREIPTRISPSASTADAVDRHDDDNVVDKRPYPMTPHLSPYKNNSDPLSSPPVTNDYVDHTLDKIGMIMRSWSSHSALIRAPHDIPCSTPHHPSSLPQPEPLSADDGPFDTGSKLAEIAERVERMRRRWLSPIAATYPTGEDSDTTVPHPSSSPLPEPFSDDDGPCNTGSNPDEIAASVEPMSSRWPSTIEGTSLSLMTEPPPCGTVNSEEDSNDPSILAAAHSLDIFLSKYHRQADLNENFECYQPSLERRLSISRHALLTQQTLVLSTMNAILSELREKLSRFLEALSCPTPYPIETILQLNYPPGGRLPLPPRPSDSQSKQFTTPSNPSQPNHLSPVPIPI